MKVFGMITTSASAKYTPHALKSFFAHTPLAETDRFYLIDNDGDFNASECSDHSGVTLIVNNSRMSFAQNVNQILEIARSERADLYFLNNDIIFFEEWLAPFLITEPCLIAPLTNRELTYKMPGLSLVPEMELEQWLAHEDLVLKAQEAHREQFTGYMPMLAVPFAVIKIPFMILNAVGPLDTDFGNGGGEDYDYCLRAHLLGFRSLYARETYLLHFGGKSSWSGAETAAEQQEREDKFFACFKKKWGERLMRIILKEEVQLLTDNPKYGALLNEGDYAAIIKDLMPQ